MKTTVEYWSPRRQCWLLFQSYGSPEEARFAIRSHIKEGRMIEEQFRIEIILSRGEVW